MAISKISGVDIANIATVAGIEGAKVAGLVWEKAAGYIMGGCNAVGNVNTIEKFSFADESISTLAAEIDVARRDPTGLNSASKGYSLGGSNFGETGGYADIDDINFSDDTSTKLAENLASQRSAGAGASNSKAGYMMGGFTAANTRHETISKFVFATELEDNLAATLDMGRSNLAGVNSATKGYGAGGYKVSGGEGVSGRIDDIDFSNDTSAGLGATLDYAKTALAGFNSDTIGYFVGGWNGSAHVAEIENLVFSNETSAMLSETLDTGVAQNLGINSQTKGYCMGGGATSATDDIQDFVFKTELASTNATALSEGKKSACGVQGGSF